MKDIPNLTESTGDTIVINEGSLFLAELNKEKLIKSLASHTCESVNATEEQRFLVRISQTGSGKVVVSFTHGAAAVCFIVKTSHKFKYDAEMIIVALKGAAAHCKQEVLDMCKHRPAPLKPVRYSMNSRQKSRRVQFNLRPEFTRKDAYKRVAAT